jgi:hypothetical protein
VIEQLVPGPPAWTGDASELVDLDLYPLLEPGSPRYAQVVEAARADLRAKGAAELAAFVRPDAMALLLADARALAPFAWRRSGMGSAYLATPDPDLPELHPRRWLGPRSLGAVAYDLFPQSSPLRVLYEWDAVMSFVEAIVGRGRLYRYADTCGALNLSVMIAGDELQWHFDQTDFVVSLALQDAERGGDFEVVPFIRSERDERYGAVRDVLNSDRSAVVALEMTPGTLLVFEGRYSLHQVSNVAGAVDRLVALLSYDTKPGTVSSDWLRKLRYGRGPEAHSRNG